MFNFNLAVKASMKVSDFSSKEEFQAYLNSVSVNNKTISTDNIIYFFDDESFLCCQGDNVHARAAGSDISEFVC